MYSTNTKQYLDVYCKSFKKRFSITMLYMQYFQHNRRVKLYK